MSTKKSTTQRNGADLAANRPIQRRGSGAEVE